MLPLQISPEYEPRLVLAESNEPFAAALESRLRRLGWRVYRAGSSREARALVRAVAPSLVLLAIDLEDESGWLTCRKLRDENPDMRLILLGSELTGEGHRYAQFVGADGLVSPQRGGAAIVREVLLGAMPAAV
jgi:DNA-binding response OmpR family regulator